jgi:hypothetical protein
VYDLSCFLFLDDAVCPVSLSCWADCCLRKWEQRNFSVIHCSHSTCIRLNTLSCNLHVMCFSAARWLGFRLEFLGNIIVFLASAVAVALRDSISGGIVGLSVSYALEVGSFLLYVVTIPYPLTLSPPAVKTQCHCQCQTSQRLVRSSHAQFIEF